MQSPHSREACNPSYEACGPSYEACDPSYEACGPSYEACGPSYEACDPSYEACGPSYEACDPSYEACGPSYEARSPSYEACSPSYKACNPSYEASSRSPETDSRFPRFHPKTERGGTKFSERSERWPRRKSGRTAKLAGLPLGLERASRKSRGGGGVGPMWRSASRRVLGRRVSRAARACSRATARGHARIARDRPRPSGFRNALRRDRIGAGES